MFRGILSDLKLCKKCGEVKPLGEFHRDTSKKDGLQGKCKACNKEYNAEYFQKNKSRRYATTKKWNKENPDKRKSYSDKQNQKYRESGYFQLWYQERREEILSKQVEWQRQNPDKVRARDARRRAREKAATVVLFTTEQEKQRWAYYGNKCWICRKAEATTSDHVKPLAKGGSHMLCNLRPACHSCNSSKNAKWPFISAEDGNVRISQD